MKSDVTMPVPVPKVVSGGEERGLFVFKLRSKEMEEVGRPKEW